MSVKEKGGKETQRKQMREGGKGRGEETGRKQRVRDKKEREEREKRSGNHLNIYS